MQAEAHRHTVIDKPLSH